MAERTVDRDSRPTRGMSVPPLSALTPISECLYNEDLPAVRGYGKNLHGWGFNHVMDFKVSTAASACMVSARRDSLRETQNNLLGRQIDLLMRGLGEVASVSALGDFRMQPRR
jgi:hypothetical protein